MNKVAVIMPTYNRFEFVPDAIKSYLNQTYKDSKLYVIDSSDDNKIEEYINSCRSDMISYNRFPKNNMTIATNEGIKISESEIITQLHSDDMFFDDKVIGKMVDVFDRTKETGVEVIYTDWVNIDQGGRFKADMKPGSVNLKRLIGFEYINFLTMSWRRTVNEKFMLDGDFKSYSDFLFKIRCLMECSCLYIPFNFVNYRVWSGQGSVYMRESGENPIEEALMRTKLHGLYGGLF